jgi:hypothetical protein
MKNIQSINPEEFIANSNSRFFVITLHADNGHEMAWRGNAFSGLSEALMDVSLFRREEAAQQYYRALRFAREETRPSLYDSGSLTILPLPLPSL